MNKKFYIYGMTCSACEIIVGEKLGEIKGVKINSIDYKKGIIDMDYKDTKAFNKATNEIINLGYSLKKPENNLQKNTIFDYIIMILFAVFIVFGYLLIKENSLLKEFNYQNMSYGVIFLIGIIASMSSCLAITGGLIIGFSKYVDDNDSKFKKILIQIKFHLGRLIGFFILGGILGLFGGILGKILFFNKFLLLLAGIIMFLMGLNMMNIITKKSNLGIKIPKKLSEKVYKLKDPKYAFSIGFLSFFLPCGFTQSIQVLASSSGSFLTGGLMLLAFAAGTFPVLFLVGVGNTFLKDKKFPIIQKLIGVMVVCFSFIILSGFVNLINFSNTSNNENTNVELQELIEVSATHNGYQIVGDNIELSGSNHYKITINPTSDGLGCFFALTIPGLDNNAYPIKKGEPIVIELKNPKPGKYKIVCTSMGMYMGSITIK